MAITSVSITDDLYIELKKRGFSISKVAQLGAKIALKLDRVDFDEINEEICKKILEVLQQDIKQERKSVFKRLLYR